MPPRKRVKSEEDEFDDILESITMEEVLIELDKVKKELNRCKRLNKVYEKSIASLNDELWDWKHGSLSNQYDKLYKEKVELENDYNVLWTSYQDFVDSYNSLRNIVENPVTLEDIGEVDSINLNPTNLIAIGDNNNQSLLIDDYLLEGNESDDSIDFNNWNDRHKGR